ncbi:A disintegrin and metalloproteinase with thrombospondin motifs 7-like isoform X1 [Chiloscyllium plagiosum]|uniref:A disintegrin and metalloproteinase with thrombospondin motifs 7-like isoform X1 n=2 Tax=Chiloscyllium plagiosum TaxID=36176 RepID=UPI001CB887E3|nr:A disintegrin and metalloproteinase with thrombospondin motifs 7-like isoform X1 [Chiloscyllium plagiosum]
MQSPWSGNASNFLQTLTTLIVFVLTEGFTEVQGKGQKRFNLQELRALPELELELVHPVRVDPLGRFLSHQLSQRLRKRSRRQLEPEPEPEAVHYLLSLRGHLLHFNLTINRPLLAPGFLAERRYGGVKGAAISRAQTNRCHFVGTVQAGSSGMAAISTCQGLKGVFRLSDEDYFIEPLEGYSWDEDRAQPHVVYKRHAPETKGLEPHWLDELMERPTNKGPEENRVCGVSDSMKNLQYLEKKREKWEKKKQRRRRIKQRSISKEKWVETLVVADSKMVEHHGSENIEAYVLTVMNMVAGLFRDASIGNSVNIVIVRLVLLEEDEEDLKITHHADNTLMNFCKWQKKINTKGDNHPIHHDVALLLTRKDICAGMNRPCETLGLSHVSGMCQPHRSCSISEDSGLPLAFTIAHELGHNFGIQHDGTGNDCEPIGKRPFIMSPQLLYDTSPLTWSRCSREYITRFLDRGWGLCLDDVPSKEVIDLPSVAPGVLYDVNHQCRLQYGARSVFCDNMDSVCNTLWCTVGNTCHSKLDAAVDGTKCGENKWCFDGDCISTDQRPERTNGNWGAWGSWSSCSRTCSAGIQSAERHCNNPTPKYGGSYCLGERKRFRVCNIKACISELPTFRQIQCSQFDSMPYKGKLHKWIPVLSQVNPCELHCRPIDGYFSEKMLDAVIDGTPCFEGNTSRDMCINGICKNVGCDYEIDSNALEDRCGVCHGNGSTCETVKKTFDKTEGLGYVDIGLIPEGAREIRIEEVAEAGNFLALRSDDPEKYFLNGGWIIQWNGDYKVAGTTFTYERTGNLENLTSPGPTKEPVWIQLLFQETNPGVRFEYTVRRDLDHENEIQPPDFFWRYGLWTECSATCGGGVQRQIVHCLEKIAGIVQEQYCELLPRPDDKQRSCHPEPCPARWWVGDWQVCSSSCGELGTMKRTVLCIQSVGLDEQRALQPSDCQHLPRPETTSPCNREIPCPSDWSTGNWSECSVTCGEGLRRRSVLCLNNTNMTCSFQMKPATKSQCQLKPCPPHRTGFTPHDWSGSGASSKELYNEVAFNVNFGPSRSGQEDNSNQIINIANPHLSDLDTPVPLPSEDNKINNHILEDDFTVHSSQAENSEKTNVFVDDFYYDYNFINFHEDLNYDPEDRLEEEEWTGEDIKHDKEHLEINNISNNVWERIPDESHDITVDDTGSEGLENVVSTPTTNGKPGSQDEIETVPNPIVTSASGANTADVELSELPTEYLRVTDSSPITLYDINSEDDEEELYEEDELLPIRNATKHGVKEILSPGFPTTNDAMSIDHMIRTHSPHHDSPPSIAMATSSPNNDVNIPNASKTWQQDYPEDKQNITDHNMSHRLSSTTELGDQFDIKAAGYTHPSDRKEQGKGRESKGPIGNMKGNPLEGEETVEKDEQEIVNEKAHFPSSTWGISHYPGDVVHVDDSQYLQHDINDQNMDVINKNLHSWESLGGFTSVTETLTTTPSFFVDPNDVPISELLRQSVHQKQTEANSPGWHHVGSSSGSPGKVMKPGDSEYDHTPANVHPHRHSIPTQALPLLTPVLATSSPVFSETTGVSTTPVALPGQPNLDHPLKTQSTSDRTQSHYLPPIEITQSGRSFVHTVTPQSRLSTKSSLTPASLHQQGTQLGKTPSSRSIAGSSTRTTTSSGKGISRPKLSAATSPSPTSPLGTSLILAKKTQQSVTALPVAIPQASISVPSVIVSTTTHSKVNSKEETLVDLTTLVNSENRTDEDNVEVGEIDQGVAESDYSNGSLPATVATPEIHPSTVSSHKPFSKNTTEIHATSTISLIETATNPISGVNTESTAYWVVGNWSECSTTCGLGAIWRTVHCSTGSNNDCNTTKRPVPARRCYIRPCSAWRVGNWSKCSRNCGGGVKNREVQCIDIRERRHLRPFHCQSVLNKPPTSLACNSKPCMDWYISAWGECSKACDGGQQERLVMCPGHGRCDETIRLNSTRMCNVHPCTKWMKGSWGRCTVRCGGGIQRRLVKCVNTVTGEAEEDSSRCDHEPWPENTQKCNVQECDTSDQSYICERDRLTFAFCQTLKLLGRCYLQTVRAQCCQTCQSHGVRDRGNERVSRR